MALAGDIVPEVPVEHSESGWRLVQIEDSKEKLVNLVCSTMIHEPRYYRSTERTASEIETAARQMAGLDAEFLLKLALYVREEMGIRSTANFLLAIAAQEPSCRPHYVRYFCAATRLPTDVLEVCDLHADLMFRAGKPVVLPAVLRKAVCAKLPEFDAHSLAKYNHEAARKSAKAKQKQREQQKQQQLRSAMLAPTSGATSDEGDSDSDSDGAAGRSTGVLAAAVALGKRLFGGRPVAGRARHALRGAPRRRVGHAPARSAGDAVDTDETAAAVKGSAPAAPRPMTLKRLIRTVHASQPAEAVMCILGKRYPADEAAFARSGLPGTFEPSRAGQRMRLAVPETWETRISAQGNRAEVWQDLIEHNKLPFMAALRNLRNLLRAGVSEPHHERVLGRLCSERAVAASKQFPFRFLAAYDVLDDLCPSARRLAQVDQVASVTQLARPVCCALLHGCGWKTDAALNHYFTVGAPQTVDESVLARLEAGDVSHVLPERNPRHVLAAVRRRPSRKAAPESAAAEPAVPPRLVARYRAAVDTALRLSVAHNLPPLPGYTVVMCDVSGSMRGVRSNSAKGLGRSHVHPYEIAMLLGLLIHHASERGALYVLSSCSRLHDRPYVQVDIPETARHSILDNMALMRSKADELGGGNEFPYELLDEAAAAGLRIDRLVILSDTMIDNLHQGGGEERSITGALDDYRRRVHADMRFISVDLYGSGKALTAVGPHGDPRNIQITGYSDRILQYIAAAPGEQVRAVERMHERLATAQKGAPVAAAAAAAVAAIGEPDVAA